MNNGDRLLRTIPAWMKSQTLPQLREWWSKTTVRVDQMTGVIMVKYPGTVEFQLDRVLSDIQTYHWHLEQRVLMLEIRTGLCDPPDAPAGPPKKCRASNLL